MNLVRGSVSIPKEKQKNLTPPKEEPFTLKFATKQYKIGTFSFHNRKKTKMSVKLGI